jgi:hypothetical protein
MTFILRFSLPQYHNYLSSSLHGQVFPVVRSSPWSGLPRDIGEKVYTSPNGGIETKLGAILTHLKVKLCEKSIINI